MKILRWLGPVAVTGALLMPAARAGESNEKVENKAAGPRKFSIAPDLADVPYGPHPKQVLDLWKAKSDKPTPLVVFIHGGGFSGGDKKAVTRQLAIEKFLKAGVSCASVNYRLTPEVIYPAPMQDGARAVQFLRSKAAEWNLDPSRVAAAGGSAGAGISLWIGLHDEMADPKSEDPVARQSTRLTCVFVFVGQCSYDPRFIKEHLPGNTYTCDRLPLLFGIPASEILTPSPEKAKLMEDCAAINHVSAGDPPVFQRFGSSINDPTPEIHHAKFGVLLKEKMEALKLECVLSTHETPQPPDAEVDWVLNHFGMK